MGATATDRLLTVPQLAARLGVAVRTVYGWRRTGAGPRAIRVGGQLRYPERELAAWLAARTDPVTPRP